MDELQVVVKFQEQLPRGILNSITFQIGESWEMPAVDWIAAWVVNNYAYLSHVVVV